MNSNICQLTSLPASILTSINFKVTFRTWKTHKSTTFLRSNRLHKVTRYNWKIAKLQEFSYSRNIAPDTYQEVSDQVARNFLLHNKDLQIFPDKRRMLLLVWKWSPANHFKFNESTRNVFKIVYLESQIRHSLKFQNVPKEILFYVFSFLEAECELQIFWKRIVSKCPSGPQCLMKETIACVNCVHLIHLSTQNPLIWMRGMPQGLCPLSRPAMLTHMQWRILEKCLSKWVQEILSSNYIFRI